MATTGSVNTAGAGSGNRSYFRVEWSRTSVDITNNRSNISWTLYLVAGNEWYTNAVRINHVKINGVTVKTSETYSDRMYQTYTLDSGTLAIQHNSDGTKTFEIEISGWFYEDGTRTGSGEFTLDSIPRASTLSVPTFTAGVAGTLSVTKASTSYTHTIQYKFGSVNWTTIVSKSSSTSIEWTPSLELLQQMPNSASKTETNGLLITTYSGSTQLGSLYYNLTIVAPSSAIPSVDTFTVAPDNSGANQTVQSWGYYIQGITKIQYALSGSGYLGSSVQAYKFEGNDETLSGATGSTGTIQPVTEDSESQNVYGSVQDTRSRWSNKSVLAITVYRYAQPTIGVLNVSRNTIDPTIINLYCEAALGAPVGNLNTLTISYEIRNNNTDTFVTSGTLTSGVTTSISNMRLDASYKVIITVEDSVGSSIIRTIIVPTDQVAFHLREGGKSVAFSKYAERDYVIDGGSWNYIGRVYGLGEALEALESNDNLNDYKEPGVYAIPTDSVSQTLTNFIPFPTAGTLIVHTGTGSSQTTGSLVYTVQEFKAFDGSSSWTRNGSSDSTGETFSWNAWNLMYEKPVRASFNFVNNNGTAYYYRHNGWVFITKTGDMHNAPASDMGTLCSGIPSLYRPVSDIIVRSSNNNNIMFYIKTDGTIGGYNSGAAITQATNGNFQISYPAGWLFS